MAASLHLIRTSSLGFNANARPLFHRGTRRMPELWNLKRGPLATTLGLLGLATIVAFFYLFAANSASSYSFTLKAMETQAYDLRVEQQQLSAEMTDLKSIQSLHDPRLSIPGVPVANAVYLPAIPNNVAVR